MENGVRRPHIAVLPTPGMGHLFPLAELAKLLVHRHHFTITFITFAASDNSATQAFLSTLPSSITSVALPPVPLDDIPDGATIETRMSIVTLRSLPSLRTVLLDLQSTTNLVAFLADFFAADGFHIARELGILYYMFIPSNLQFLTVMFELPALDAAIKCEFPELEEPVRLPGCVPIPGPEILTPLRNRSTEEYKWMLHHAALYRQAQGILVNSFVAIEPGPAKILTSEEQGRPPVYPVGPMIQARSAAGAEGAACLRWLDEQPAGSVIFVSFGSGGTLSRKQLWELAMGLEQSKQRFLWVVRSPCDEDSSSTYFTASTKENPLSYLPEGFTERTKEVGLVVPSWAPQIDVLGHAATGGFLSHCGWNSTLESVAHGVPMIAWPLFAEQTMNAVMLAEAVRIAIRPVAGEDGFFYRGEIARVVRELMEGEQGKAVRNRVWLLKEAAGAALSEEGSSLKALDEVAAKWKSFKAV
ncbi:Hydroquinone glucosyltransferase [Apostasia shenzhenica]|uniref:Glycosyltransferase n=1 Tax=Apostasia shenzhenica TaxID=1088818 RepID=A0A2I0ATT0_9ASPA|nr:Hydroquinone glucosyltransferase [Apostasia shenzhenica]